MTAECWRPCRGFPAYEVSDRGRVRRCVAARTSRAGRLLEPRTAKGNPYPTVTLRDSGRAFTVRVHVLVLEAFVGPRPVGKECLHGDDDPSNARLSNLRWGSSKENTADCRARGRLKGGVRGEQNGRALLTAKDIRAIRASSATQSVLAHRYGVDQTCISRIQLRKTWRHVL